MGASLYLARPIRAAGRVLDLSQPAAAAPATVIARYGSSNGFGWQANDVIGAQIVSVPVRQRRGKRTARFSRVSRVAGGGIRGAAARRRTSVLYCLVVRRCGTWQQLADQAERGRSAARRSFRISGGSGDRAARPLFQSHAHQPRKGYQAARGLNADAARRFRKLFAGGP